MKESTIKKSAILLGIISFIITALHVTAIAGFLNDTGPHGAGVPSISPLLLFFLIDASVFAALFISSFGLYKMKKWGYILSNACIIALLCGFLFLLINHFFPDLHMTHYSDGSGWHYFFHMNINFWTFLIPSLFVLFLIALNLKSTRLLLLGNREQ